MKQNRTIAGIWWLPDKPDQRWMGTLKLACGKSPELKLTVETSSSLRSEKYPEVLHGCDQHGSPITLFHLGQDNSRLSSAITKLRYSAGFALPGIKLNNRSELQAGVLRFHMQHLFEWVARSAFQNNAATNAQGTIGYVRPESISVSVGADLTVKVVNTCGAWSKRCERGIRENAYIEFSSEKKFGFTECEGFVTSFRHLLHFASLETVYPTRIACSKFDDSHLSRGQEAEICSGLYREEVESEFQSAWWIFQLPDVQSNLGSFLEKWFADVKKYEEAMGSYFTTVYFSLPDSIQHICLTQALLAFHGIKNQAPGAYGFEKHIRSLAETYGPAIPSLCNDPADFAKLVTVTRHYYTHFNPKDLAGGAARGTALFHLNEKLRLLFQMCILSEMGIPSARFPRLQRQLATHVVAYD